MTASETCSRKNRMHKSCSYGTAGAGEGNLPLYPDPFLSMNRKIREKGIVTRISRIYWRDTCIRVDS